MAMLISDDCTSCGACEADCPNDAITEGDDHYVIDAARCTECVGFHDDPQCVSVCPSDCIASDPAHAETREALLAKKAQLHPE